MYLQHSPSTLAKNFKLDKKNPLDSKISIKTNDESNFHKNNLKTLPELAFKSEKSDE